MSATKLDLVLSLTGREIFTAAEAPSAENEQQRTITTGAATKVSKQLTGSSTPKVDKPPISKTVTISGTTTLDLTSIAGLAVPPAATRTLDMTGAKVVVIAFKAADDNAAVINIAPGGSNPYPLFGTGNDIDLRPGMALAAGFGAVATTLPAVSGTVKTIDFTGTNGDEVQVDVYLGT